MLDAFDDRHCYKEKEVLTSPHMRTYAVST